MVHSTILYGALVLSFSALFGLRRVLKTGYGFAFFSLLAFIAGGASGVIRAQSRATNGAVSKSPRD
jgi:hypothetical protein